MDNDDDSTETIHKFLSQYEQFEEDESLADELIDGSDKNSFDTRAIFTIADFLKGLSPNEYYDIAQKLFTSWENECQKTESMEAKLTKLARIGEKRRTSRLFQGFSAIKFNNIRLQNNALIHKIDVLEFQLAEMQK